MAPTATGSTPAAAGSASTSASTTAAAAAAASTASQPGSLEEATQRYQATKLALRTGLANKRTIDRALIDLESQIYLFEGSYLQSTASSGGNIVKGFDSYLKNSSTSTGSARGSNSNSAALGEIPIEDRIFSLSSATYQKSLELKANEGLVEHDESSANNTPKAAKTAEADTSTGKKKKDKDAPAATPAAKDVPKKKKDKDADSAKHKDKERSSTPSLKAAGGGKNSDAASAAATPTKGVGSGSGGGKGTATKLKRKLTDGAGSGAGTPSAKAQKRKKDDD
ncbi:conserved hypothetical protein [Sporisorium reilianum SRZ2]|uniref:Chromatin modification-related protein EAF6 n=1 Tax=Sporisorium reilianum (strain SRZ2) TaxID=999809 RepID=E6ZPP5_SPORE|nr:conserved hypothetical protein [Sporisorium reilianum SRZ2]